MPSKIELNGLWKYLVTVLLLPLLALAVAWGATGQRISNTEDDVTSIQTEMKDVKDEIKKIDKKVDRIQILQEIDLKSRGVKIPDEHQN